MLTINNHQIAAINDAMLHSFQERLLMHLNHFFPEQPLVPGKTWSSFFKTGINLANECNLQTEYGITVLFNLMFAFELRPSQFAELPWMKDFLDNHTGDEADTISKIIEAAELELSDD